MSNKKGIIVLILFGLIILSCKKDTDIPGINLSNPVIDQEYNIGDEIIIEGLAVDNEELKEIRYKLESPDANYYYSVEGTIPVTGTSAIFNDVISIPYDGPIGDVILSFYSVDISDNFSDVVYQKIKIIDNLPPDFEFHTAGGVGALSTFMSGTADDIKINYRHGIIDNIDDLDSLVFSFFKNSHDLFDSVSVYNHTSSELLFTGTETGAGFGQLLLKRDANFSDPGIYFLHYDFTTVEEDIYVIGHRVHITPDESFYDTSPAYLTMTFIEKNSWRRKNEVRIAEIIP